MLDVKKLVVKILKVLGVILLGLMAFIIFILSSLTEGWQLPLFTLLFAAVPFYGIRAILGFTKRPLESSEWKVTIAISVLFIFVSAWGTVSAVRKAHLSARNFPALSQLEISSGVLKEGVGGVRYIKRDGKPDLRLSCADYVPSRRGGPDNYCLYEAETSFMGKEVTVYHLPARKVVNWRAAYFAMYSGKQEIVSYDTVVSNLRYRDQRRRSGYQEGAVLFLGVMGAYCLVEGFIRRRRTKASATHVDLMRLN